MVCIYFPIHGNRCIYIYIRGISVQNSLHLSSCYCHGYRSWGWPNIFEIQHKTKIQSNTGSEMDRAIAPFVLHSFACFFIFHSFACILVSLCIHFLPCSFSTVLSYLSLIFISIDFPFMFLSLSFQFAFMSSHLPFICTHVPFILHVLSFLS